MKIKRKKRPVKVYQPLIDNNYSDNSSSENKSVGFLNLFYLFFVLFNYCSIVLSNQTKLNKHCKYLQIDSTRLSKT
jgi:hypothetical protein